MRNEKCEELEWKRNAIRAISLYENPSDGSVLGEGQR